MSIFHPLINIDIDKSYCIRLNSGKKNQLEINKMLRNLSEDKTNWSTKILTTIHTIIEKNNYDVPYDLLEVRFNNVNSVNYEFKDKLTSLDSRELLKEVHTILDNNTDNRVEDVFLQSNPKYNNADKGFNDIQMAQIILLLSELSKLSSTLWLHISLEIRELGKAIFYFVNEDGHIALSKRIKINNIAIANSYIQTMNDIIDGKRDIPR